MVAPDTRSRGSRRPRSRPDSTRHVPQAWTPDPHRIFSSVWYHCFAIAFQAGAAPEPSASHRSTRVARPSWVPFICADQGSKNGCDEGASTSSPAVGKLGTARQCDRMAAASPFSDRKSTRLNSSHVAISYAVFCLKKKTRSESLIAARRVSCRCCRLRRLPPRPTLFPYTTLFRSARREALLGPVHLRGPGIEERLRRGRKHVEPGGGEIGDGQAMRPHGRGIAVLRSEEHTSELQSRGHLVCRLLLEKKNAQRVADRCPACVMSVLSTATASTAPYPLSLHDALPICASRGPPGSRSSARTRDRRTAATRAQARRARRWGNWGRPGNATAWPRHRRSQIGRAHV